MLNSLTVPKPFFLSNTVLIMAIAISQYPRLLVDFEAEVKMTGSVRVKNRQLVDLFFENKVHFLSHQFGKY